jgi:hypothetical protein
MRHFPCPKRSRTICEFAIIREGRLKRRTHGPQPNPVHSPNFILSIIAGGGRAGMLTGRVYHDDFERVLLVEPERSLFGNCGHYYHRTTFSLFIKKDLSLHHLDSNNFENLWIS